MSLSSFIWGSSLSSGFSRASDLRTHAGAKMYHIQGTCPDLPHRIVSCVWYLLTTLQVQDVPPLRAADVCEIAYIKIGEERSGLPHLSINPWM